MLHASLNVTDTQSQGSEIDFYKLVTFLILVDLDQGGRKLQRLDKPSDCKSPLTLTLQNGVKYDKVSVTKHYLII